MHLWRYMESGVVLGLKVGQIEQHYSVGFMAKHGLEVRVRNEVRTRALREKERKFGQVGKVGK